MWNELTILWNDLTIDWNDLTWKGEDKTWTRGSWTPPWTGSMDYFHGPGPWTLFLN